MSPSRTQSGRGSPRPRRATPLVIELLVRPRSSSRLARLMGVVALALAGCGSDGGAEATEATAVDLGLPGGADGLEFVPLEPGGSIALQSFGQGGTHAVLGVRASGLGNRAFVSITISNAASGDEVSAPAGASPRLLRCLTPDVCDLIPLLVMTGGLVPPGADRDGLLVHVRVEAWNTDGRAASVERAAVLSTALL
jgi:hypothetical protein